MKPRAECPGATSASRVPAGIVPPSTTSVRRCRPRWCCRPVPPPPPGHRSATGTPSAAGPPSSSHCCRSTAPRQRRAVYTDARPKAWIFWENKNGTNPSNWNALCCLSKNGSKTRRPPSWIIHQTSMVPWWRRSSWSGKVIRPFGTSKHISAVAARWMASLKCKNQRGVHLLKLYQWRCCSGRPCQTSVSSDRANRPWLCWDANHRLRLPGSESRHFRPGVGRERLWWNRELWPVLTHLVTADRKSIFEYYATKLGMIYTVSSSSARSRSSLQAISPTSNEATMVRPWPAFSCPATCSNFRFVSHSFSVSLIKTSSCGLQVLVYII